VLDLLALKTKRAPPTGFDCSRYPDWWIFISQLLNEVRGERWLGDGTPSRQPHIEVKCLSTATVRASLNFAAHGQGKESGNALLAASPADPATVPMQVYAIRQPTAVAIVAIRIGVVVGEAIPMVAMSVMIVRMLNVEAADGSQACPRRRCACHGRASKMGSADACAGDLTAAQVQSTEVHSAATQMQSTTAEMHSTTAAQMHPAPTAAKMAPTTAKMPPTAAMAATTTATTSECIGGNRKASQRDRRCNDDDLVQSRLLHRVFLPKK
jgi:hypothetical protein